MGRTVEKCTEIEAGRGTRDETHPRHRLLRDNSRTERVEPPRLLLIQDVPQQPSQPQPSASLSPLSSLLSPLSSPVSSPPSPTQHIASLGRGTYKVSPRLFFARPATPSSFFPLLPPPPPPPPSPSPSSSSSSDAAMSILRPRLSGATSSVSLTSSASSSARVRSPPVPAEVEARGRLRLFFGGGEGVGGAGGGGWHDAGEGLSGRRGEKKERSEGEGNRGDENVRGGCGVLKSALLRFFLLSCSIIIRLSCWPRSTTWGILSILSQGRGQRKARFAPEDH